MLKVTEGAGAAGLTQAPVAGSVWHSAKVSGSPLPPSSTVAVRPEAEAPMLTAAEAKKPVPVLPGMLTVPRDGKNSAILRCR